MKVRFHGVRGSTPTPGLTTVRYGGNTVCVEVRLADGTLLILDAGTGMRELGNELRTEGYRAPIHLLLTHLHWDHIQGLPFFKPIWQKDTHLKIYPLTNATQQRAGRRYALFDGIHFPVAAHDVPARIELLENEPPSGRVGSATISRVFLNHPGGAQGFRIDDADGASLAYLTDNELSATGPRTTTVDQLARFADGVDLVVHDSQYTESEMATKRGWGHSAIEDVLVLGKKTHTPHLVLFHHDPERDDAALDTIGARANEWLKEHAPSTTSTVAREGMSIELRSR